jgi:MFS family permease
VITAYTLAFGGFLIPGGRLADLIGSRRMFLLGLGVFVLASVGCALAWSPGALVGARIVQGVGAALLSPAALALLSALSEPGAERRRAVGWWTAAAATGGASGWVLGGVLTETLGWRSVFWVNLPIGLIALVGALRLGVPAPNRALIRRLDLLGALGVTTTLPLGVYGLTSTGEHGLTAVTNWTLMLVSVGVLVLLVGHERRIADPLVPPALLRSRAVVGGILTSLAITATTSPAMFLSTLYVQQELQLSPARASSAFPVFNIAVVGGSLLAPTLLRRLGARRSLIGGFATMGVGCTVLIAIPRDGHPIAYLLVAFALMGAGLGAASVASTQTGTEAVDVDQHGVVAGTLTAAAQVGTALGLALTSLTIAATGRPNYQAGFIGTLVVAFAGLGFSLLVPSRGRSARVSAVEEESASTR